MSRPLVSLVITNYNYSAYLRRCVESCLNQKCALDYEVIVVDDGSTDDSAEILRSYSDARLHLLMLDNGGIETAANAGIKMTRGKWFARVDADDYLLPGYLERMTPHLGSEEHAFFYPDYKVVDGLDVTLDEVHLPPFSLEETRQRGDFLATGTLYRKAAVIQVGLYEIETRNCGLENYHLILKLIAGGNTGLHIPHVSFAYRRHNLNISATRKGEIVAYGRRLFQRLGLGPYRANQFHPYKLEMSDE